jgi:hypothetical protein
VAIVAPDGAERALSSRRRSYDDVVDDGHVAAGGCDRSRGQPENVSSVFCEIAKKTIAEHSNVVAIFSAGPNSFQERVRCRSHGPGSWREPSAQP